MASLKCALAFVLLAATIGRQVDADADSERMEDLCLDLSDEMSRFKELQTDVQKAFEFVKNFIENREGYRYEDQHLIKAWQIVKDGECIWTSPIMLESWHYLRTLKACLTKENINVLVEPLKKYYRKCLTPEYVSGRIRYKVFFWTSTNERMSLVDAEFMRKYYEDNPDDTPLHVSLLGKGEHGEDLDCCRPERSHGAIKDALERRYRRQGRNPKRVFRGQPLYFARSLKEELFEPCDEYVRTYKHDLASALDLALWYHEGGEQQLIASLKENTKHELFIYKFCAMLRGHEDEVSSRLAKDFV